MLMQCGVNACLTCIKTASKCYYCLKYHSLEDALPNQVEVDALIKSNLKLLDEKLRKEKTLLDGLFFC
jgi:hypothetical protein